MMRDRVTEYAQAVVDGKVPFCGRYHILACKRHLRDLKRQRTKKFPYYWSVEAANDILDFAEGTIDGPSRKVEEQEIKLYSSYGQRIFKLSDLTGEETFRDIEKLLKAENTA